MRFRNSISNSNWFPGIKLPIWGSFLISCEAASDAANSKQGQPSSPEFWSVNSRSVNRDSVCVILGLSLIPFIAWSDSRGAIAQVSPAPIVPAAVTMPPIPTGQYLLFINPVVGNDSNVGSQGAPLKTITHALQIAQPNTVIVLASGVYSAETGEVFPLVLKSDVTLQGDPSQQGQSITIRGGGTFLSPTAAQQNITMLGANRAVVTGVTLTNPNLRGYGLWIESSSPIVTRNTFQGNTHDGISVAGNSAPFIQGNNFIQNGANGITVYGTSQPQIRENLFRETGFGININQNAAPLIVNNQITQNRAGIVVQGNARPILRNNTIEASREDGMVAIAQSLPNLGTAAEPGNNTFRGNGRYDINASAAKQTISAAGNQLTTRLLAGQIDLTGAHLPIAPAAIAPVASANLSPAVVPSQVAVTTSAPTPVDLTPTPNASAADLAESAASFPRPTPGAASSRSSVSQIPIPTTSASVAQTPTTAIEIPVPPAATVATRPLPSVPVAANYSSQAVAVVPTRPVLPVQPQPVSGAIEIPVPPPATGNVPNLVSRRSPIVSSAAPAVPAANLLPVPKGDPPLGNIGDMPTVTVARNPLSRSVEALSVVPSQAPALGLRYRVVVEADDEGTQTLLRSLVPGAFRTYAHGQVVMQVGAFSDRANADETAQRLVNNGLKASVQPIE